MTRSMPLLLTLLLAAGCNQEDEAFTGTFNSPANISVLSAEANDVFKTDIGFVANRHGGRIRALNLAGLRYITGSGASPSIALHSMPTGGQRLIMDTVSSALGDQRIMLHAADQRFNQIVTIPFVQGIDAENNLIVPMPDVSEPVYSGNGVELVLQNVTSGGAATEDWTLTCNNDGSWKVFGTRSGQQQRIAWPFVPYYTDDLGIQFTLLGSDCAPGDTISFSVDNGTTETDLPGAPISLSSSPDQQWLAVAISDVPSDLSELWWLDPATGTPDSTLSLPSGSEPGRLAWSADSSTLFLTDHGLNTIWAFEAGAEAPTAAYELPFVPMDVAPLSGDDYDHLYIARADENEVWLLDQVTGAFIDINPATASVDPMPMSSPVRGLAAVEEPYEWFETSSNETRRVGRSVAVSLWEGNIVWMRERTGCLLTDGFLPTSLDFSQNNRRVDYEASFPLFSNGYPFLEASPRSGTFHFTINECTGVAQDEPWSITYDGVQGGWVVESRSGGVQETLAMEETRYVSDDGLVSFLLHGSTIPSEDGWEIRFSVRSHRLDNSARRNDEAGLGDAQINQPGRPAIFHADWSGERQTKLIVPSEANDFLSVLDATNGWIEFQWR